jgi:hypothetical protein
MAVVIWVPNEGLPIERVMKVPRRVESVEKWFLEASRALSRVVVVSWSDVEYYKLSREKLEFWLKTTVATAGCVVVDRKRTMVRM